MDPQETLQDLHKERARILRAPVIDLDRRDEIKRSIAYLIVRIAKDRLVGAK